MFQRTDLNRSTVPAYRGQGVGERPESDYAGSGDVSALETQATDHESRIATLETQVADLLTRMTAAETGISDHEDRITALEP